MTGAEEEGAVSRNVALRTESSRSGPQRCRKTVTKIFTWYSTQHAYLLEQMAKVDLGGRTLLDESVVFFGSQQQSPATHQKDHMPFLLAGGGGGLEGGRVLSFEGQSHNDLLTSLANLFGDTRTTFGDLEYCSGPLSGL